MKKSIIQHGYRENFLLGLFFSLILTSIKINLPDWLNNLECYKDGSMCKANGKQLKSITEREEKQ
jgi:hypothetical protein